MVNGFETGAPEGGRREGVAPYRSISRALDYGPYLRAECDRGIACIRPINVSNIRPMNNRSTAMIHTIFTDPSIRNVAAARVARMIDETQRVRGVGLDAAVGLTIERVQREESDADMRQLLVQEIRGVEQTRAIAGAF